MGSSKVTSSEKQRSWDVMHEARDNESLVRVRVVPGARIESVESTDTQYVLRVREKARHGAANERARTLLAETLGVPQKHLALVRGKTTPTKLYRVLH